MQNLVGDVLVDYDQGRLNRDQLNAVTLGIFQALATTGSKRYRDVVARTVEAHLETVDDPEARPKLVQGLSALAHEITLGTFKP